VITHVTIKLLFPPYTAGKSAFKFRKSEPFFPAVTFTAA
jgi:hypothetical protein